MKRVCLYRKGVLAGAVAFFSVLMSGCTLPFQKDPVSGLQITTGGIDAAVVLNGQQVGTTPFSDQAIKPGSYSVRLEPVSGDLATYETTVRLYPDTMAIVNWEFGQTPETSGGVIYELQPLKRKSEAHFSLSSIPDGAIVKVDDVSQGFTPVLLKSMTKGTHRFGVSLPGYKERDDSVNISEGLQLDVIVKLAKQKSSLSVIDDSEIATNTAQATHSAARALETSASSTAKDKGPLTPLSGKTVTIKSTGTGWLRVRESTSTGAKELTKVDVGKTFPLLDEENGWFQIEYEVGKKGWISAQYAQKN